MSAYCYPNFKSKAALRRAITTGERVMAAENTPWGKEFITDGSCTLEGPHFPQPHRWYGQAIVKNGLIISVK